jgi:hypothetical protein
LSKKLNLLYKKSFEKQNFVLNNKKKRNIFYITTFLLKKTSTFRKKKNLKKLNFIKKKNVNLILKKENLFVKHLFLPEKENFKFYLLKISSFFFFQAKKNFLRFLY